MIEEIKTLRTQIDGYAQLTKELKPINSYFQAIDPITKDPEEFLYAYPSSNSKEIDKAVDSLYLAKAWLGKLLGELGTTNPYGSGYKTREDIVPTQDVSTLIQKMTATGAFCELMGVNQHYHIERVNFLRTEIEKLVKVIKDIVVNDPIAPSMKLSREFAIARTNCYTHLCEARFWLGFELERLKNEK